MTVLHLGSFSEQGKDALKLSQLLQCQLSLQLVKTNLNTTSGVTREFFYVYINISKKYGFMHKGMVFWEAK